MSKGSAGIPALHLTTLNKLIDMTPPPADVYFSNLFPAVQYPSDQIEWEVIYGSGGMTPFIAPGSSAPTIGGDGIGYGAASCAFMAEKTFLDEQILNNLRKAGTDRVLETAQAQLTRRFMKLKNRCTNRREWMMAKMLIDGAISYQDTRGMKLSVSFGIPTQNLITLTGNNVWGTGSTRNPTKDLFETHEFLADQYGYKPEYHIMNTATLKLLMFDSNIVDLAKNAAFGTGNPTGTNGVKIIAELLGIGNLIVNDNMFEIQAWLTSAITGTSTTELYIDDASDFEVGGKIRISDLNTPQTWETRTISAVNKATNTVTVSAAPTASYVAGRCKIVMRKKYVPDNKILMFTKTLDGMNIAEMMEAPHTLDRRWGMTTDTWDDRDPAGTWMKIEDKCFPVLYRPEAISVLTVA